MKHVTDNKSNSHIQKIVNKFIIFILVVVLSIYTLSGTTIQDGNATEINVVEVDTEDMVIRSYPNLIQTLAADVFVYPLDNVTVKAAYTDEYEEENTEVETEETGLESDNSETEVIEEEPVVEIDPYEDYLTSSVSELNIRATPSTEAEIIGILKYGDYAVIKDSMENWYYIESGEFIGWVYREYTITGTEAYNVIQNYSSYTATVNIDGLNMRSGPSTNYEIINVLYDGTILTINSEEDGWINVTYGDQTGYVNSDYVSKSTTYSVASALVVEETSSSQSCSDYELTLLACIIWCEAGNQSYTGMVAVAAVVLNRVDSAEFPDNIYDVLYQSDQFSPVGSGWFDRAYSNQDWTDECMEAAKDALNGWDPTDGCLYFSRGSSGYVVIGDHAFRK